MGYGSLVDVNANAAYFHCRWEGKKDRMFCRHENYLNECIRIMNNYNMLRALRFCSSSTYFPIFLGVDYSKPGTAFATAIFAKTWSTRAVARKVPRSKTCLKLLAIRTFRSLARCELIGVQAKDRKCRADKRPHTDRWLCQRM
jgi:hypothetical protein